MTKTKRKILSAIVFVLVVMIAIVTMRMHGARPKTVLDYGRSDDNNARLVFSGTTLVGRKDGRKIWEISAKKIKVSNDQTKTYFHHIHDGTVFEDESPLFHLSAGRAVYDSVFSSLLIEGGVRLSGPGGIALNCQSVSWDNQKNRLLCPGKIQITFKNGKMTGQNLEARNNLNDFTLQKIHLNIRIQGNEEALQP